MRRNWFIYTLLDGKDIFYVGRTFAPTSRLNGHRARFGAHIEMKIVQQGIGDLLSAAKAEAIWIRELSEKHTLANKMRTGKGGVIQHSPQTIAKLRKSIKALWLDPNRRIHFSKLAKEQWKKPGAKARLSKQSKALWANPKMRRRITRLVSLHVNKPEIRQRQSLIAKGMATPAMRRRVSKAVKALWKNPEYRKRQVRLIRERTADPNARKHMSLRMKEIMSSPEVKKRVSRQTKKWFARLRLDPVALKEYRVKRSIAGKAGWATRRATAV